MTAEPNGINGTIAPLRNVSLFRELMQRVQGRAAHLPGMATFHGPSGYGKTFAATYAAHKARAFYVEVGETWTRKKFCQALLTELGGNPRGSVADLVEQIIERLSLVQRPVIIDEADHVVKRGYIDLIREIHDKTTGTIILIGEELLPHKLLAFERVHNRMLDWGQAEPAGADDAGHLARLFAPRVTIHDDLLQRIAQQSDGRVRRICVNIERVREFAAVEGYAAVGLAEWGDQPLHTGQPPARRV